MTIGDLLVTTSPDHDWIAGRFLIVLSDPFFHHDPRHNEGHRVFKVLCLSEDAMTLAEESGSCLLVRSNHEWVQWWGIKEHFVLLAKNT